MKLGVLTFHDADNYGAVLQAYALKETLKRIEEDVEIVNYLQPYIIKEYKLFSLNFRSFMTFIKSIAANLLYLHTRIIKKYKFNQFRKKHMDISSEVFHSSSDIKGYGGYIVGSDQIWNGKITNYDAAFFLSFCSKACKRIAYAASIGNDTVSVDERGFLKGNINNIDYISVRENSAIKILEELTEKKITHVLDPTLLADKSIWDGLSFSSNPPDRYLLVYMLSSDVEILKIADTISKKTDLQVILIDDSSRIFPYGFRRIKWAGPEEFIMYIRNSSFIVTDSFHGTAFSVIYNKDFVTIPHKTRGNRMRGLLETLQLNSRILTDSSDLKSDYDLHVDFSTANRILGDEKAKSFSFLEDSIRDIQVAYE